MRESRETQKKRQREWAQGTWGGKTMDETGGKVRETSSSQVSKLTSAFSRIGGSNIMKSTLKMKLDEKRYFRYFMCTVHWRGFKTNFIHFLQDVHMNIRESSFLHVSFWTLVFLTPCVLLLIISGCFFSCCFRGILHQLPASAALVSGVRRLLFSFSLVVNAFDTTLVHRSNGAVSGVVSPFVSNHTNKYYVSEKEGSVQFRYGLDEFYSECLCGSGVQVRSWEWCEQVGTGPDLIYRSFGTEIWGLRACTS